jgi:hypothetical protein
MKEKNKSSLLSFYFGSISESERLDVERELLIDPGLLTEFFDLKRKIESAEQIPSGPSVNVWHALQAKLSVKKKFIFPIAFGAAIAASVIAFLIFLDVPKKEQIESRKSQVELIFDSGSELPVSSNVL